MLDIKFIRENPEIVRQGLAAKGVSFDLQALLHLDADRRTLLKDAEDLKARRNLANDHISTLRKEGKDAS